MITIIVSVLTVLALVCYVMLAMFFWRNRDNPILRALCLFFAVMSSVYACIFAVEVIGHVSTIDPIYGTYRPIFFRSAQGFAALWLVWVLNRKCSPTT